MADISAQPHLDPKVSQKQLPFKLNLSL